jgi:hypothetical protein
MLFGVLGTGLVGQLVDASTPFGATAAANGSDVETFSHLILIVAPAPASTESSISSLI